MAFAQDSWIQCGYNAGAVSPAIDYGPYSSDQWARLFRTLHTSDQQASQGVVRGFEDELEVYNTGTTVYVKPGAGMCNGHPLIGIGAPDWAVGVTAPSVGHTRCDYVVMLENNTAGVYAPGAATMQTPNSADYGGIANQVPEFSCRLAVIKGAEDAACPPAIFSQTGGLYMVPLASIEWDAAQAIDTVTDLRHYIHEFSQVAFVQSIGGILSGGAAVVRADYGGWPLVDASTTILFGNWRIPPEMVPNSDVIVTPVVNSAAVGNLENGSGIYYGPVGGNYNASSDTNVATSAIGVINRIYEVNAITLNAGPAAPGDYLSLIFQRLGGDGNDTIEGTVYFMGWKVTYTAAIPWD